MPLKVIEVQPRGQAAKAGIGCGDTILSINAMPINDFFDLEYYGNDYQLDIQLLGANGTPRSVTVLRQPNKPLGIEPEAHRVSPCVNNCVFCFIDQLPQGLRSTLYKKDDDYLFSYVFGNYITLNNLRPSQLKRIANQHISPLYVSVHSTDPWLREKMMRYKHDFDILNTLRSLGDKGISFHFQIVCLPQYNCGDQLRQTIRDLTDNRMHTLSVGVVPVGITGFRDQLTPLQAFTPELAAATIDLIDALRQDKPIVQAADELYVQAARPVPEAEYYGEFPQLENGIGMLRLSQMNYRRRRRALAKELEKAPAPYVMLTSRLAKSTLEGMAEDLNNRLEKSSVRVKAIDNRFLGGHISVSGLMTASDILSQLEAGEKEGVIIPSNIFNHDGLTLDDVSQIELRDRLGGPLLVVDQYFEDWEWI
ncbi:MAG: DUF512 domain-containing protein [Candidatus Cloacimonetes bacterium]|nr:DUF512 domain-containing protein [Candidatus Cloacimonadota bacterium]